MKTPPIVSLPEWDAACQQLLVKEKELTRARDALAVLPSEEWRANLADAIAAGGAGDRKGR